MPISVAFIRELDNVDPQLRHILLSMFEELERQREESVTKKEFNELQKIVRNLGETVKELAVAQKQTEIQVKKLVAAQAKSEERLTRLEKAVEELTAAQAKSEERLTRLEKAVEELTAAQAKSEERLARLEKAVEELTAAQAKSEERLTRLEKAVEELTAAQAKSEERLTRLEKAVEELTVAQAKSEERLTRLEKTVEELAEAQKRTEEEITKLVKRMDVFEDRLEGISNSVGYGLENSAYRNLPKLLAERYSLKVEGRLVRRYINLGQKAIQVNIYGHARKNGKRFLILGECKVRPSKKEIGRFEKYAMRIAKQENEEEVFLLFVAHDFPPQIEELLQNKGIAYFWSYEFV